MKSKLTHFIIAIVTLLGLSAVFTPAVYADVCSSNADDSVKAAAGCPDYVGSIPEASTVITNVVSAIIGFLGVVALVFVLVGGINYMTAAGDPGKIKTAKNTIIYALIGLIICALAFAIVNFAVNIINQAQ